MLYVLLTNPTLELGLGHLDDHGPDSGLGLGLGQKGQAGRVARPFSGPGEPNAPNIIVF